MERPVTRHARTVGDPSDFEWLQIQLWREVRRERDRHLNPGSVSGEDLARIAQLVGVPQEYLNPTPGSLPAAQVAAEATFKRMFGVDKP